MRLGTERVRNLSKATQLVRRHSEHRESGAQERLFTLPGAECHAVSLRPRGGGGGLTARPSWGPLEVRRRPHRWAGDECGPGAPGHSEQLPPGHPHGSVLPAQEAADHQPLSRSPEDGRRLEAGAQHTALANKAKAPSRSIHRLFCSVCYRDSDSAQWVSWR